MTQSIDDSDKDEVKDEFELARFAFVLFAIELVAVQPLANDGSLEQMAESDGYIIAVNLYVRFVGGFAALSSVDKVEQAPCARVLVEAFGSTSEVRLRVVLTRSCRKLFDAGLGGVSAILSVVDCHGGCVSGEPRLASARDRVVGGDGLERNDRFVWGDVMGLGVLTMLLGSLDLVPAGFRGVRGYVLLVRMGIGGCAFVISVAKGAVEVGVDHFFLLIIWVGRMRVGCGWCDGIEAPTGAMEARHCSDSQSWLRYECLE